jgi:hypothetical protein
MPLRSISTSVGVVLTPYLLKVSELSGTGIVLRSG